MNWRKDLLTRMRGAALSEITGTRIAWMEAQRSWGDTMPQMVMTEVSVVREHVHDGHSDGLDRVRVQFDIYADTAAYAEMVEFSLLSEMERALTVTTGNTVFHYGQLVDRDMTIEIEADQRRTVRLRMDFEFFHETI